MDRRDILADNPVEKRRGYMPGVSVSPGRILFTAGMTGRQPDGTIVPGGMAAQTQRTMERLQAILQRAEADFSHQPVARTALQRRLCSESFCPHTKRISRS